MHEFGYCLGFDYGLKKTGVAVGQFVTHSASPLPCLLHPNGRPARLEMQKLIDEWRPKCLVVGLPKSVDGKDLSITAAVMNFAHDLEYYQLPVYLSDERLTTKEARQQLFEQGGYRALAYGKVDSLAAVLILEQWMQEQLRIKA